MTESVSWAYSTINSLRQCNRKYYFANVLASHGRKNPLRRKAYELKKMQNLTMWKGTLVDKFIEIRIIPAIKNNETINFESLATEAVELAKRQFDYSKGKNYNDPFLKKKDTEDIFCILDIHELGKQYDQVELDETFDLIRQSILNIEITKLPNGKPLIDFLKESKSLVPNISNWMVYLERAMVKPQIDLLAYYNWKPVVIDWKLSESFVSDYSRQLIICGLTVYMKRLENRDKDPYVYEDIKLYEVNLLKATSKEHEFSEERINEVIDYINLTSQDIYLLTKGESESDIDDFELTDDEGHCKFCNFRSLCSYQLLNQNVYNEKAYAEFVQNNQFA